MSRAGAHDVDLVIEGMTCGSCAARVERQLNRIDGVEASVNYATRRAAVTVAGQVPVADLISAVEDAGYHAALPRPEPADADAADRRELDQARRRLAVSAVLTAPIVALSMIRPLQFDGWQWWCLLLATPVVVWGAWPFHRAAWANARHRATTMDTLVSVGVLAAYGWSVYALLVGDAGDPAMRMDFTLLPAQSGGSTEVYFEVAAGVTTLILAGRFLEARATRRAGSAIRSLLDLGAKDVAVLVDRDGETVEERVPVERLAVGQRFVARPGERVATDGVVRDGTSAVDASMLTGESVPVEVGPGAEVVGGTVNIGGRLVVEATRVGADTQLAQLARLVEAAQTGKAPVQRLADRVSAVFVPAVIAIAVATFAGWLLAGGSLEAAFSASVAVLIIACPCALGLATPTALMVGTGRGAQLGIVIAGPQVLEATRRVDTVVVDKTGTVTEGRMRVLEVAAAEGHSADDVLAWAGALEHASEHPIARAVAAAAARVRPLDRVDRFGSVAGLGVEGEVGGRRARVGRRSFAETGEPAPEALAAAARAFEAEGATTVWAAVDDTVVGVVAVGDAVRPTSMGAIADLRRLGLEPVLATGDNASAARAVAAEVGIGEAGVRAGLLPGEKWDVVSSLQRSGRVVAMVGDGVNDAPALAQADLGIAMGAGSDIAIEASDLTLATSDLRGAARAVALARATLRVIRQNLFWAFAYNVAAIPLAAAGLLNPLVAGAAMALSSVFVVSNSLRLRRFGADAARPAAVSA